MQKWEQGQLLLLEVRVDMGGRLQLLLMSLQIIEGVVSVSMEMGQQHHWGAMTPPPRPSGEGIWMARIRGFGWWGRWWTHLQGIYIISAPESLLGISLFITSAQHTKQDP